MKNRRLSDAVWIAGGQALTALGTVVGIRVLTGFLDPAAFGKVSLGVGLAALALNVACTPISQAGAYLYPALIAEGNEQLLTRAIRIIMRRYIVWIVIAFLISALTYLCIGGSSIWTVVLVPTLFACDCWRSYSLTLMNAAETHKPYAIWMSLDAWGRPLVASVLIAIAGSNPDTVLMGYVLVSILLSIGFRNSPSKPSPRAHPTDTSRPTTERLVQQIQDYAWPLVPLGFIGWANGLGDRYIIGSVLSLADAGVYAAVYGLASRPLLIVNATVEQALRPIYQQAVSSHQPQQARRILAIWLSIMIAVSATTVVLITAWHRELGLLLLGPQFRSGSNLMPWIASGYALLTISYAFERVCYAHGKTLRVLAIQSCTAITAVVATLIGTIHWGVLGAAVAVPVYFSVQLAAAFTFAHRAQKQRQGADYVEAYP